MRRPSSDSRLATISSCRGSLIIFVLLIVVQNIFQDNIDEEHGVAEE